MVVIVALILKDGDIAEDSEAVGKTSWDEELTVVVFGEFYRHMLSICGRSLPDVDGDVKYGTFDTTDELGLGEWRLLEVEASHDAIGGTGFVVLNEFDFGNLLVEFPLGEGFEEIAAGVFEDAGLDDDRAVNFCMNYIHQNKS